MTNPVFNYTVVDEYGDEWPNAICRIDTVESFEPARSTRFIINEQDQYSQESSNSDAPIKITYSTEFWSKVQLKAAKRPPRQFKHDGDVIFEIDMESEQMQQIWSQAPKDFQQAVVYVAQWHFRNKLGK